MESDSDAVLISGRPREVAAFAERNRRFLRAIDNLNVALNAVISRDIPEIDAAGAVVFFLGRRCVEDFEEILLLCVHGYSGGASVLLRSMYERAVTASFIHQNTDAVANFIEYDWVRRRKLLRAIEAMPDAPAELTENVEELEAQYQRVRERFLVTDCAKCGTRRLNHTWSKTDFVTMASQSPRLGRLVIPAYYLPLGHAHSTLISATSRVKSEGSSLSRVVEPDHNEADMVLSTAHAIVLLVLAVLIEHFGEPDNMDAVNQAVADHDAAWKEESGDSTG